MPTHWSLTVIAITACFAATAAVPRSALGSQDSARVVASTDGVPIHYEVRGTGAPTLVFVHGWSCDRGYWDAQLEAFSQRHQVVAVDLAGHGDSGRDREAFTIASFGEDVAAALGEVEAERIVLIGHSMGGDVVVQAARHLRDRTIGLVWVDTYTSLDTPRSTAEIEAMIASLRPDFEQSVDALVRGMFPAGANEDLVARVAGDMASAPPDVALAAMESSFLHAREVPRLLAELDLPVFAINPAGPETDVESLRRHGVEVVPVEGVGHFMMMEDPQRFDARLAEVIERLR